MEVLNAVLRIDCLIAGKHTVIIITLASIPLSAIRLAT